MSRFLRNVLIFTSPFFLYLALALYIDPFNLIKQEQNPKLIELKEEISYKLNYPLYKLIKYDANPANIVVLGDSRSDKLKHQYFEEVLNEKVDNLSYGGGSIQEIIDTFWEIKKNKNLKTVFIGLNFNLYNKNNCKNRVLEAISLKDSPLSYILSKFTLKSTLMISQATICNSKIELEKPPFTEDEFWNFQLNTTVSQFYGSYIYPQNYFDALKAIAEYSNSNNIKLIFFIPPTHIDLQNRVKDFNLTNEEHQFKMDLSLLAETYDFDYPNEMTQNRNNFLDPFHFNDSIAKVVINEIASGKLVNGKRL